MENRLSIRQIAALLVLVAVAAIFVLPAFDMPDTTLRAKALAQLVTLVLCAIAATVSGLLSPAAVAIGATARDDWSPGSDPSFRLTLPLIC